MKKHLIIFSLIFTMFAAHAQEVVVQTVITPADTTSMGIRTIPFCPHRVNIYLGGSMTNNIYNRVNNEFINTNYSLGAMLGVNYAYFFNEHWGLTLGVGIGNYSAKASLNFSGTTPNYNDPAFNPEGNTRYDLRYKANNLTEKQTIWAIEIPLQAQFEHKFGGRNGIYAGLGVRAFIPVAAKSKFPTDGTLTTRGYEAHTDALYQNLPGRFETKPVSTHSSKTKLRASIDLQADFGGVFAINNRADFYVGVYTTLGFLDILPKGENKTDFITPTDGATFNLNSLMGSNYLASYNQYENRTQNGWDEVREKWNLFQVGLKLGVHIKACAGNSEPSLRDLKKKYYDEMARKANEPIVIKNTEYVYIVPTCPEGYEDDENLTQQDKDNIRQLAEALSNTKILFDLDKDIPKVSDQNRNIDQTVSILKRDKSLGLIIEGYTCDLGSEQHNRDLAERRARAVRQIFVDKGVAPSQIEVASYTYNDPENRRNIPERAREEHRAAIFRIVKY